MDRAADGQARFEQVRLVMSFPNHVRGGLPLEAGHTFVEVHVLPVFVEIRILSALGPRAHDQARIASSGVPATLLELLAKGAAIGYEVVLPQRAQGTELFLAVEQMAEVCPVSPRLSKHLIDVTTGSDANLIRVLGIFDLDKVFAVEGLQNACFATLGNLSATSGERIITHFRRHLLAGFERRQVERTNETDLAEPSGIQRVGLGPFDNAVLVGILADEILDRHFDFGPEATEKLVVGRHLMLAQNA